MLYSDQNFRKAIQLGDKEMALDAYRKAAFNADNAKDIALVDSQWSQFLRTEALADSMAKEDYVRKLRDLWLVAHRLTIGSNPAGMEMIRAFTKHNFYQEIEDQVNNRSLEDFQQCYLDVKSILDKADMNLHLYAVSQVGDSYGVGLLSGLNNDGIDRLEKLVNEDEEVAALFNVVYGDNEVSSLKETIKDPTQFEDQQIKYRLLMDQIFDDFEELNKRYGEHLLSRYDDVMENVAG